MLHCARECARDEGGRDADSHITFGEFCVFATELRRYYANHERDPTAVLSLPRQVQIRVELLVSSNQAGPNIHNRSRQCIPTRD